MRKCSSGFGFISGRPRSVRSDENIEKIRDLIEDKSKEFTSVRKIAETTGLKRESARKILKQDLKCHPYKLPIVQELSYEDPQKRIEASEALLQLIGDGNAELTNIIMTDESIFDINNSISPHHKRLWSSTNPHRYQQRRLQPQRVHVWCGMTAEFVIGPYFFENTVTAESYIEMLQEFLYPELRRRRMLRKVYFQQDGAPAHTANATLEWLHRTFKNRVISKKCDLAWPPRSPDLTPPDFFLWRYVKLNVKKRQPSSLDQLKEFITDEIDELNRNPNLLMEVFHNFVKRLNKCVEKGGYHVF